MATNNTRQHNAFPEGTTYSDAITTSGFRITGVNEDGQTDQTFIIKPNHQGQDDVQASTVRKIGTYMSNLTKGQASLHANPYPLDPTGVVQQPIYPTQITPSENTSAYVNKDEENSIPGNAKLYGTVPLTNPDPPPKPALGDSDGQLGSRALLNIGPKTDSVPQKYATTLLGRNRFNAPAGTVMNPDVSAGNYGFRPKADFNPTIRIQTGGGQSLGSYSKDGTYIDDSENHLS